MLLFMAPFADVFTHKDEGSVVVTVLFYHWPVPHQYQHLGLGCMTHFVPAENT